MSKVAIVGDPSGTGTFTISAPNGNTDRTLVLPDEAGTVLTTVSSISSSQITGLAMIGVGQTWSDVSGSRAVGTEYQNTTGKPIMVSISITAPFTSRGQIQVSTTSGSGFVVIADSDGGDYYSSSAYTDHYTTMAVIIPNNHYYKLIAPDSNVTVRGWRELS
jgi:hypothetical protein